MPGLKSCCSIASLCLAFAASSVAHATYTVTFTQMGNNVVATGAGSLETSLLALASSGQSPATLVHPTGPDIEVGSGAVDIYTGDISGPAGLGTGGATNATSTTGSFVGLISDSGAPAIYVPHNYISGTPLDASTATFANQTFATLGLHLGISSYAIGPVVNNEKFIIVVPEPASLGLLALGSLGLLSRRRRA